MAILTVFSEEDLDALLARYGLGARTAARGIEAGTVNTSWRVEMGGRAYFLRIYEEQDHAGARREAALLEHLAASGVPTPRPLAAIGGDGGAPGVVVQTLAGKPAALFPWVDGEILCQARVTPAAGRMVGAALARIHLAPASAATDAVGHGRFGPRELVARCARVATAVDPTARPLAGALAEAVETVAARRAPRLSALPAGLVHGDLFRDNVLWQGDNIAALLDFESASLGPRVYDVAVTILSWAFGTDFLPDVARAIVDGYRSVRELEPVEREGLYDETVLGALRFTITRITDDAARIGKKWQRFVMRREALERLGPAGFAEVTGT